MDLIEDALGSGIRWASSILREAKPCGWRGQSSSGGTPRSEPENLGAGQDCEAAFCPLGGSSWASLPHNGPSPVAFSMIASCQPPPVFCWSIRGLFPAPFTGSIPRARGGSLKPAMTRCKPQVGATSQDRAGAGAGPAGQRRGGRGWRRRTGQGWGGSSQQRWPLSLRTPACSALPCLTVFFFNF